MEKPIEEPIEGAEEAKEIPAVINKKVIAVAEWIVELVLQDHLLAIACDSLEHDYRLSKEMTQVPPQFSGFCQNLYDLRQLLQTSGSLQIQDNYLLLSFQMGKLSKLIKLKYQLERENLTLETCLLNKSKLLQQQRTKLKAANAKIHKLQIDLLDKEAICKLLQTDSEKLVVANERIAKLSQELINQKSEKQKARKTIDTFNEKYDNCTKWGCQNVFLKSTIQFHCRSGPVCSEKCRY